MSQETYLEEPNFETKTPRNWNNYGFDIIWQLFWGSAGDNTFPILKYNN